MTSPRSLIAWMIIVLSLVSEWATCRADEPEGEYLSDRLADRIVSNTQGWGELGFNTAVQPAGRQAMPLKINDIIYIWHWTSCARGDRSRSRRPVRNLQGGHGNSVASRVLADCGHPAAPGLAEDARRYQADLLAAYHWTQARAPVLRLENGTWAPALPALLDCFGKVEEFLPGEDGNRSWAYSVELGPHHLAALGILDPRSPEVDSMLEYLEGSQFLRSGMGD